MNDDDCIVNSEIDERLSLEEVARVVSDEELVSHVIGLLSVADEFVVARRPAPAGLVRDLR